MSQHKKTLAKSHKRIIIICILAAIVFILSCICIVIFKLYKPSENSFENTYVHKETYAKPVHDPDYCAKQAKVNYHASYQAITDHYWNLFSQSHSLLGLTKIRLAAIYSAYAVNYKYPTDLKSQKIVKNNKYKSYDKLLEDYIHSKQANIANLSKPVNFTDSHGYQRFQIPAKFNKPINSLSKYPFDTNKLKEINQEQISSKKFKPYSITAYNGQQLIYQNGKLRWKNVPINKKAKSVLLNYLMNHRNATDAQIKQFLIQNHDCFLPNLTFDAKNLVYGENTANSIQFKPKMYSAVSTSIPSTQLKYPFTNFHNYNLLVRAGEPGRFIYDREHENSNNYVKSNLGSAIADDPWQVPFSYYTLKDINYISSWESFKINNPKEFWNDQKDGQATSDNYIDYISDDTSEDTLEDYADDP